VKPGASILVSSLYWNIRCIGNIVYFSLKCIFKNNFLQFMFSLVLTVLLFVASAHVWIIVGTRGNWAVQTVHLALNDNC
jgi:hypothetical protein